MPTIHLTEISVRALKGSDQYISYYDQSLPAFGVRCGKRSKTWVVLRGKNRERITLGKYPAMSLADARAKAKQTLAGEPEAKPERMTFGTAKAQFLETYASSTSDWPRIVKLNLDNHFKSLTDRQLTDITDADISDCLGKVKGPSAKLHAYRIARTFLNWCTKPPRRFIRYSPMQGYEPPGKDRKGTRTLTDDELVAIWKAAETGSRSIFRLLILWGTRGGETARLARKWRSGDVLTIPGESTKNGRDHSIPILPLADTVLSTRPTGDYYFPGRRTDEASMTPGALNKLRYDIQKASGTSGWQARDLRRTFRSNMARLRVPRDVCEVLINHAPAVLDEIYDRYDRIDEKREALAKYEAFLVKLIRSGSA